MNSASERPISRTELKEVERFADELFAALEIDIAFTHHFYDRLNDPRNGQQISVAELKELFQEMFRLLKTELSTMSLNTEAVVNDVSSRLNIPFVLVYDHRNNEVDLVAKTIMRKRNFKTHTPKYEI